MARDVTTDREALGRDDVYGTPAPLLDRASLYDFLARSQDIVDWVLGFLEPVAASAPVLDVGCGDGKYTARLAGEGRPVVAMDLSPGMARATAGVLGRRVVAQGDVQALPFRAEGFGAVLAPHMLYHPADISRAVREIAGVLAPRGVLVALTNGAAHLAGLWEHLMTARSELAGLPLERYTPSTDRFSLENGGDFLRPVFDVEQHVLRNRVVVPAPAPLLRYVGSVRPFFEDRFPSRLP